MRVDALPFPAPALAGSGRPALRSVAQRYGWVSLVALGVLITTPSPDGRLPRRPLWTVD